MWFTLVSQYTASIVIKIIKALIVYFTCSYIWPLLLISVNDDQATKTKKANATYVPKSQRSATYAVTNAIRSMANALATKTKTIVASYKSNWSDVKKRYAKNYNGRTTTVEPSAS